MAAARAAWPKPCGDMKQAIRFIGEVAWQLWGGWLPGSSVADHLDLDRIEAELRVGVVVQLVVAIEVQPLGLGAHADRAHEAVRMDDVASLRVVRLVVVVVLARRVPSGWRPNRYG